MTREDVDARIVELLREHGSDTTDGHDQITDYVMSLLEAEQNNLAVRITESLKPFFESSYPDLKVKDVVLSGQEDGTWIVERRWPGALLQCVDCRNTESPAGAMARHFNHGRCAHCGGWFKVVRA